MIDYWEAIGRLACDGELAKGLMGILPKAKPFPWVETIRDGYKTFGIDIPLDLYSKVQNYLEPHLSEQWMSVNSAGELIWACSYPGVRKFLLGAGETLRVMEPKIPSVSTGYFIALGVVICDPGFRHALKANDARSARHMSRLSMPQQAHLCALIDHKPFNRLLQGFEFPWEAGCGDDSIVQKRHLYSPGLNAPPAAAKPKTAAAGG